MIATNGSLIGIDVGFSPTRRSSAICRIDWSETTVEWEIARFRALEPERENVITRMAAGRRIAAAAVDGPIRRGFDIIARYRTAERMLTRRIGSLIGKPGQSSALVGKLLNHHANECVRYLLASSDLHDAQHSVSIHQKCVVEAFPSSFLGLMIVNPKQVAAHRGNRSDTFFQHLATAGVLHALVQHLLPGRRLALDPSSVVNHDDRAALICAFSALSVAVADFVAVGDDDGWIILPPRRFIQSLQWSLLSANAGEEKPGSLHIAGNGSE
jgi:hypothetical protein